MRFRLAGLVLAASVPVLAAPFATTPNSQRYREAPAATGRSGNATLSLRALLSRDGSAQIDVVSGTFDQPAVSSQLKSVQLKALRDGGVAFTRVYKESS